MCEILLRYLQHDLTGHHIPFGTKIGNFAEECKNFEKLPRTAGPESFRVIIPRALLYLYTLRNKRGIGQVGGDVDENEMDALACARVAKWCLGELIRARHRLSVEDAQQIVDKLSQRDLPFVWEVLGKKRILSEGLSYPEKSLLLLYSDPSVGVAVEDLFAWTEHSNLAHYRRAVLGSLHRRRFVEFDKETNTVLISPKGIGHVQKKVLQKIANR